MTESVEHRRTAENCVLQPAAAACVFSSVAGKAGADWAGGWTLAPQQLQGSELKESFSHSPDEH